MWARVLVAWLSLAVAGVAGYVGAAGDYVSALRGSWQFYEAQRSGRQSPFGRVTWRRDSFVQDRSASGACAVGGNFDAGDNVYLGFPYAWTVSVLAYGIHGFERGHQRSGEILRAYDNLRWMADFVRACYVSDDEIVVGLGDPDADHARWTRPEDIPGARVPYAVSKTSPGADVAAGMAAALAASSQVFRDLDPVYSEELLATARSLFDFAVAYPGLYSDSVPVAAKYYKSSGYLDELAWAATWLGIRTGNTSYTEAAKNYLQQYVTDGPPWPLPSWDNGYHYALVLLSQTYAELRDAAKAVTDAWIDGTAGITYTPKGLAWAFQWGSLRHTCNAIFYALAHANAAYVDEQYRHKVVCWAKRQMDYVLGSSGRSFVVGVGDNPPCRPHHRGSSCPDGPCDWSAFNADACNPHTLVGALVGGPGADDSYVDDRKDYVKNEVALDYNAGFTSALAALLQQSDVVESSCGDIF